jgi:hypothetical protein
MPRGGCIPNRCVEGGVQVTCLGFDDGRFLGMLKQRADLGAPSVNRDDEKTTRAGAEELAYLLQLFIGDHMPQVSGNALRAWQNNVCGRHDRGIDCGSYE